MNLALFNDQTDDAPDKVVAAGFAGFDTVTEPTQIDPSVMQDGRNVWTDTDLMIQTRPGLQFVTLLTRATLGSGAQTPKGVGYYDIPGFERVLAAGDGKLYEIEGSGNNVTSTVLTPTPSATEDSRFAQLVDRMFRSDGVLAWHLNTAGTWSHGTVTTFSDSSDMPAWTLICAHAFRLFAYDPVSNKIYASAIGEAHQASNWVKTENIRVGTGEGDPTRAIISGQGGNLVVINERSAWMVDTSDASVANWVIRRITSLAGTVEGKTAVQIGQDVFYLSGFGVVSLGALSQTDSIQPSVTLSAPIQSWIDRINAAAVSTAWATMWREHYVLAVPIDDATQPDTLLTFNVRTRRWNAPWTCTLPDLPVGDDTVAFAGWAAGLVTNFGGTQETLILDNTGRVLRIDKAFEKDASAAATTQEIESWATLKAFTHDLPETLKSPFWMQVEFLNSTASDVQLNFVRDGNQAYPVRSLEDCEIIAADLVTNSIDSFPIKFPLEFLPNTVYAKPFSLRGFGRYLSAAIQLVSQSGRMKLRSMRLASFVDTPPLI